ncbi:MAG: DUF6171 family protein [Eubacteriales bacterium]|nr:DUF6171 family protein [Eubacteriales bacterium]
MEKQPLRICRKCLPPGKGREEYFESLGRYIQQMDESVKVDQETYEKRLAVCGSCEKLLDGMCRLCGCFVELRAAQRVRKCPDIPAKWKGVPDESQYSQEGENY